MSWKMMNERPALLSCRRHGLNVVVIGLSILVFSVFFPNTVRTDFNSMDNYLEWVTSASLRIVNNWLTVGIFKDKFIMYEDFPSIEFEKYYGRNAYVSYPPGALVPLYFSAKLLGKKEISIGFVKKFVQAEYCAAALFLGWLFYAALITLEVRSKGFLIIAPFLLSSLWVALPFNVYYMKNVYFADEAVILLSIMYFLLEILLYNKALKKYEKPLQASSAIVLFAGLLTDYYFACIALVTFLYRISYTFQSHPEKSLLQKIFSNTWMMILAVFSVTMLFISQVLAVPNGLELFILTFLIRTGSGAEHGGLGVLALHHFRVGFTAIFLPVLVCVTLFCLFFPFLRNKFDRPKQLLFSWLSIITLSSVLHTLILREHSIVHEFSMLKYNLVFVFIVFSLSYLLYSYNSPVVLLIKKYRLALFVLMAFLAIPLFLNLIDYNRTFYQRRTWKEDHSLAQFIRNNTSYYDVVYSPDYEIYLYPPQDLTISRKRVYKISRPDVIPLNELPDRAIINILISEETLEKGDWRKLKETNIFSKKFSNYYLFKLSKKHFRSLMYEQKPLSSP